MMSPGSHSSGCISAIPQQHQMDAVDAAASVVDAQGRSSGGGEQCVGKKRCTEMGGHQLQLHNKSIDTFVQRTPKYKGVSRNNSTGRYNVQLKVNKCNWDGQKTKGGIVSLGTYDTEEKAARAYDLAALKYSGPASYTNFPLEHYREEIELMKSMTCLEYFAHLRSLRNIDLKKLGRRSSQYKGVSRQTYRESYAAVLHDNGLDGVGQTSYPRRVYLGTYDTEEKAARAYDLASLKYRGQASYTNFPLEHYREEIELMKSMTCLEFVAHLRSLNINDMRGCRTSQYKGVKSGMEPNPTVEASEWTRMATHESPQEDVPWTEEDLLMCLLGDPPHPSLHECEAQLDDLEVSDSRATGGVDFSNSSSLVSCLGDSSEGMPAMLYNEQSNAVSLAPMSPWMQMPHSPWMQMPDSPWMPANDVPLMHNGGMDPNPSIEASEWRKMVLHESPHEDVPWTDEDLMKCLMGDPPHRSLHEYESQLDDLEVSYSRATGGVNFSNSSSLVTSLEDSSEAIPAMLYNEQGNAVNLAPISPWMQMPHTSWMQMPDSPWMQMADT